jgi:hypothetical protein
MNPDVNFALTARSVIGASQLVYLTQSKSTWNQKTLTILTLISTRSPKLSFRINFTAAFFGSHEQACLATQVLAVEAYALTNPQPFPLPDLGEEREKDKSQLVLPIRWSE